MRVRWVLAAVAVAASGAPALAQPPPSGPDDFVSAVAGADAYEMMAARVALVESKDARVRGFATEMLRDHAAALSSLQDAARRSGLTPPEGGVGGDQTQLLAALQGLRGPDFDKAYARQQVLAHRQAAATEGGYLAKGSDPNLRRVAEADVAMIRGHLQAAQDLQAAQGGASS